MIAEWRCLKDLRFSCPHVPILYVPLERMWACATVFLRAIAPYLASQMPSALAISINDTKPTETEEKLSPYSLVIWSGGWGSWTQDYQNGDVYTGGAFSRIEREYRYRMSFNTYYSWEKLPDLIIDGQTIPLVMSSHGFEAKTLYSRDINKDWAWGAILRGGMQDPESLFEKTFRGCT